MFVALLVAFGSADVTAQTEQIKPDAELQRLVDERDAYIETFRYSGSRNPGQLRAVIEAFGPLLAGRSGAQAARARLEYATTLRVAERFDEASAQFRESAQGARDALRPDLAFDAYIGLARAAEQLGDARTAADAYELAVQVAGLHPSLKQAHDIAAYGAQIAASRGDLEQALFLAAQAASLTNADQDRFYDELNIAGTFLNFAESCDYRRLIDDKSGEEGDDSWNACRRAADDAYLWFGRAAAEAAALGWAGLQKVVLSQQTGIAGRKFIIQGKATAAQFRTLFHPQAPGDVLVNENFVPSPASSPAEMALGAVVESTFAISDPRYGARRSYMLGVAAAMRGDDATALELFREAARQLSRERAGYFDPRRRGTLVENRPEIIRDLGLRLLASGARAEAFDVFESARARGLGELVAAMQQPDTTDADRTWLARLVRVDALASAAQTKFVERAIASGDVTLSQAELDEQDSLRRLRQELLQQTAHRERAARDAYQPITLAALTSLSRRSGIPVLLYWETPTNLIVWVIGPNDEAVKTVFVTDDSLGELVRRVVSSARSSKTEAYDDAAARELYLYLLAPFEKLLGNADQLLVVPQGSLTDLPFEALIAPDGHFAIDRWAFSYAANATFAARTLGQSGSIEPVARVFRDPHFPPEEIESITPLLRDPNGRSVVPIDVQGLDLAGFKQAIGGGPIVHVMAHGKIDNREPLLSTLAFAEPITATDLIDAPLRHTDLVVLSGCETGEVERRISGEIYGLPWALTVAGASGAIVSRWRIDPHFNAPWMTHFYTAIAQRRSPALAAAVASRAMIAAGNRHPYRWAAMQVSAR
jgi:CHAT domain-containing protein